MNKIIIAIKGISKGEWLAAIAIILAAIIGVVKLPTCNKDKMTFVTENFNISSDTIFFKFSLINNYNAGSLQIQDIKFHTLLLKKEKEDFFENRIDLGIITILPNQREKDTEIENEPTSLVGNYRIGNIEPRKSQSFLIKIPKIQKAKNLQIFFMLSCYFFDINGNQKIVNSKYFYKIIMDENKNMSLDKYRLNHSNINKIQKEYSDTFNMNEIIL